MPRKTKNLQFRYRNSLYLFSSFITIWRYQKNFKLHDLQIQEHVVSFYMWDVPFWYYLVEGRFFVVYNEFEIIHLQAHMEMLLEDVLQLYKKFYPEFKLTLRYFSNFFFY